MNDCRKDEVNNMKILIIIPAYNEEESILSTVQTINEYNIHADTKLDYVVINDGSTDKTKQILEEYHINHVTLVHNLGIGGAVQTGYKYALENNYDIAIQFDGDGQHDINYVPNIVQPIIENKADFCIGSRFVDPTSSDFKSTGARRAGIKIICALIKLFAHKRIYDATSGFRAANQNAIKYLAKNYPTEYPEPESIVDLLRMGYRIEEVPVQMHERSGGVSSIRAWKSVYYMINVSLSIIIASMKGKK